MKKYKEGCPACVLRKRDLGPFHISSLSNLFSICWVEVDLMEMEREDWLLRVNCSISLSPHSCQLSYSYISVKEEATLQLNLNLLQKLPPENVKCLLMWLRVFYFSLYGDNTWRMKGWNNKGVDSILAFSLFDEKRTFSWNTFVRSSVPQEKSKSPLKL